MGQLLTRWLKRCLPRTPRREYESASSALLREMAQADRDSPDWDRASRICTCADALNRGVPARVVRVVYGEAIYRAATLPGG